MQGTGRNPAVRPAFANTPERHVPLTRHAFIHRCRALPLPLRQQSPCPQPDYAQRRAPEQAAPITFCVSGTAGCASAFSFLKKHIIVDCLSPFPAIFFAFPAFFGVQAFLCLTHQGFYPLSRGMASTADSVAAKLKAAFEVRAPRAWTPCRRMHAPTSRARRRHPGGAEAGHRGTVLTSVGSFLTCADGDVYSRRSVRRVWCQD